MIKILIIEDDTLLLETAADFLREEGFEVLTATSGEEGVEIAGRLLPDIILCDILMPGMDGYKVFEKLREGAGTDQIPFIFLTAKASKEDIRHGMELGADDYITKPVDFRKLKKVIGVRLEKYNASKRRNASTYQALFEMDHDAILVIRPTDRTISDINRAGLDMLGYRRDELAGQGLSLIFVQGDHPGNILSQAPGSDLLLPFASREFNLRHKNGETVPVQISGSPLEITNETLFLLMVRNLSDLREKEEALRESNEKYRDLVENTGEGLGMVDTTEDFIYANPAACEIFGLPGEQLIGKNLTSFIDPVSIEQIRQQTAIRKKGLKSIYELEIIRPDGERRWIIVTATPQYDRHGNFVSTFGIFRDITQRKLAEKKVMESENRLREIVELTSDWIWEISPEWRYKYVSPKVFDILGYQPEELIGHSPFEFLLPEDVEPVQLRLRSIVHNFLPLNAVENRARHKNGTLIYLETSGIPIYDKDGNYAGYRGADRDITTRKQNERELIIAKEKAEESDRLKSSILANISHELRTPLNGILGFSEILKEELADSDFLNMVENIHNSGKRLMSTLNSIITLSQLEAGKIAITPRETLLGNSILAVVRSMGSLAKEKGISLETHDVENVMVITDDQMFKQLLRQILDNAIKFTETGAIRVATSRETYNGCTYIRISVTDTGIGIEKDYFDLIFQEFRQVSEGFGRKFQGSGIGLTISKKIIDLLEGRITVESEPGKGSCFSIWLPSSPDTSEKAGQAAMAFPEKTDSNEKQELPRILLVEDNLINKDLTELFLKPHYSVDHAANGTVALEMVEKFRYDAILMDINLGPGKTGLDVTRTIRNLPGYGHNEVPVIAVTGYILSEDQELLMQAGCNTYISKPFDKKSLLKAIENEIVRKKTGEVNK